MKKLLIPILTIVLMSVTSCEYFKTSGDSDGNDSCDTSAVEELHGKYNSPDLMFKDLKGKVKECAMTMYTCDEKGENANEDLVMHEENFVFDEKGYIDLESPDLAWRLVSPKVKRDDDNFIVEVKWYISDYDTYVSEEFVYNSDKTIKIHKNSGIESEDGESFTYADDGTLLKSVSTGAGEGSIFRTTSTYKILETDENGNWTRRLVKQIYESGEDNGSEVYDEEPSEDYYLQVRNITYWE